MQWKFLIPAVLFAALFGVFAMMLKRTETGNYDPHAIASPLIGKQAPSFRLAQVEDTTKFVDAQTFAGKPYVVNVWATWCVACREEHAQLLEIAKQKAVPLIGLDWNDDLAQAQRWLNVLGNPYVATGFDNTGKVAIDFGVYGAPETFLIDSHGVIQFKFAGPMTQEVWDREFLSRLRSSDAQ